jgi:hypothetical protein
MQRLGCLLGPFAALLLIAGRLIDSPAIYIWGVLLGLVVLIAITFPANCRRRGRHEAQRSGRGFGGGHISS